MLGENIRYLRKSRRISQHELSEVLGIPRTTLGDYEREKTEPNVAKLVEFAKYFDVRVDDLLRVKLQYKEENSIEDNELRILAITVDDQNEGNIELVKSKARAGYVNGFQDPEYISELPKIRIPNLPEGTYRAFEIEGDSMLPLEEGSIVICRFEESIANLKEGKSYVVISRDEGIVYKRLRVNHVSKEVVLISDNEVYLPYSIPLHDVSEIWRYQAHIGFSDQKIDRSDPVEDRLVDIQRRITSIENKLIN